MFLVEDKQLINDDVKSMLSSAIKQNEKVLYIDYAKQVLTTVCLGENNVAYIRESSIKQTIQISTNFNNFEMSDMQIDYAFLEGGDGFLLFKNPLTIFFITKQNETPIKLTLNTEVRLKSCLLQLNYPNITIYGAKNDSSKSQIFQVSLQTLNLKTINDGKGYSPGSRTQSLSILVDGRIYTFGGRDQNRKTCDKMIWVYDLEKGYWFALQMEYPSQQDFECCQKVILSTKSKILDSLDTSEQADIDRRKFIRKRSYKEHKIITSKPLEEQDKDPKKKNKKQKEMIRQRKRNNKIKFY